MTTASRFIEESEYESEDIPAPTGEAFSCKDCIKRPQTKKYVIGTVLIGLYVFIVYLVVAVIYDIDLWIGGAENVTEIVNATENATAHAAMENVTVLINVTELHKG